MMWQMYSSASSLSQGDDMTITSTRQFSGDAAALLPKVMTQRQEGTSEVLDQNVLD
jgi:hypothetical protein